MLRYEMLCYFTLTLLSIFLRASKCLSPQLYFIRNVLTENVFAQLLTQLESTGVNHKVTVPVGTALRSGGS